LENPVLKNEIALNASFKLGELILNQPKSLNSLDMNMVVILEEALEQWRDDPNIVAILLRGAGDKSFCAGGNIKSARASALKNPHGPCHEAEAFFKKEYKVDYTIHTYPKPIICLGHGFIMGGGMGLFQAAEFRLLMKNSVLAMPEISIGLFTDVGAGYFYNNLKYDIGLFLGLTGAQLQSSDAFFLGLCDAVIQNSSIEEVLLKLQDMSWSKDVLENRDKLKVICQTHFETNLVQKSDIQNHLKLIESICQKKSLNEMVQEIHKTTHSPFLNKASQTLKQGSPISAHLIYHHLRNCKTKTLKETFDEDTKLSTACMRHPEFAEGVRALLIDKDNSPNWTYKTIEDVPEHLVIKMLGKLS